MPTVSHAAPTENGPRQIFYFPLNSVQSPYEKVRCTQTFLVDESEAKKQRRTSGWSVLVCAFVCAFVSAFVCSFRGLFACVLSWVEIVV